MRLNEKERALFPLLRQKVEERFAHKLETFGDFTALSNDIFQKTGKMLSESFLKRFWGYMPEQKMPRESSLNILASYAGYDTFSDLSDNWSSRFCPVESIQSADLQPGNTVGIAWYPDRKVTLRYLGDSYYEVTDSIASKLQRGDRFSVSGFLLGSPLLVPKILRESGNLPAYMAGLSGGLTALRIAKG